MYFFSAEVVLVSQCKITQVSPWMDNGTVVDYAKKFPSADRMKLLTDAASGKYNLHCR